MNELHVRALLVTAMSFDHRKPGESDLAAWMDAANTAGWQFDEAQQAIREHYAESAEWIMPGHITARIRAGRRLPRPVREVVAELPAGPPADPTRIRGLVAELAARLGWQRATPTELDPLAVDCPAAGCLARAGRPCVRQVTRGARRGTFVPMRPHPSRRERAAALGNGPPGGRSAPPEAPHSDRRESADGPDPT